MFNRISIALAVALCACGGFLEYRLGAAEGIPKVAGSQSFSIGNYTCGMTFSQGGYTVTTTVQGSDCLFAFDQQVQVLSSGDYQQIPDLKVTTNLVKAVELNVTTLSFVDASNNMALDINTYIKAATLKIDGQQVADKTTLSKLPATVRLEGATLTNLKSAIDARVPASVHATATLLVPMSPAPPMNLKVIYDAQPTIVLGPSVGG
jgi:hypothetical protein